jgi:hypothetical protein
MLRIPHCLDNRLTDGGKFVSLMLRLMYDIVFHKQQIIGASFSKKVLPAYRIVRAIVRVLFHIGLQIPVTRAILLLQPLWSSGQSFWLQIQRSGFEYWRYRIFWEVVGLERGPLSLVSTIEELLKRKSSGFGLENRDYGHRDPLRWPRDIFYQQKLALTSLTSGGLSVGVVRSRTDEATEFSLV